MRTVALVHSPMLQSPKRIEHGLMHITDISATILSLASLDSKVHPTTQAPLDGVDQWALLSGGGESARAEVLHNIDPIFGFTPPSTTGEDRAGLGGLKGSNSSAIRVGDWKLIVGYYAKCRPSDNPDYCGWKVRHTWTGCKPCSGLEGGPTGRRHMPSPPHPLIKFPPPSPSPPPQEPSSRGNGAASSSSYLRVHAKAPSPFSPSTTSPLSLFNVAHDPYEMVDVAADHPHIVAHVRHLPLIDAQIKPFIIGQGRIPNVKLRDQCIVEHLLDYRRPFPPSPSSACAAAVGAAGLLLPADHAAADPGPRGAGGVDQGGGYQGVPRTVALKLYHSRT